MVSLFRKGDFISHAGVKLKWKIDCDALTAEDLDALAYVVSQRVVWQHAVGIPRGGLHFAHALNKFTHSLRHGPILLVDDVFTTGQSMREYKEEISRAFPHVDIKGVVIFARGPVPDWIYPIFNLSTFWEPTDER